MQTEFNKSEIIYTKIAVFLLGCLHLGGGGNSLNMNPISSEYFKWAIIPYQLNHLTIIIIVSGATKLTPPYTVYFISCWMTRFEKFFHKKVDQK